MDGRLEEFAADADFYALLALKQYRNFTSLPERWQPICKIISAALCSTEFGWHALQNVQRRQNEGEKEILFLAEIKHSDS